MAVHQVLQCFSTLVTLQVALQNVLFSACCVNRCMAWFLQCLASQSESVVHNYSAQTFEIQTDDRASDFDASFSVDRRRLCHEWVLMNSRQVLVNVAVGCLCELIVLMQGVAMSKSAEHQSDHESRQGDDSSHVDNSETSSLSRTCTNVLAMGKSDRGDDEPGSLTLAPEGKRRRILHLPTEIQTQEVVAAMQEFAAQQFSISLEVPDVRACVDAKVLRRQPAFDQDVMPRAGTWEGKNYRFHARRHFVKLLMLSGVRLCKGTRVHMPTVDAALRAAFPDTSAGSLS